MTEEWYSRTVTRLEQLLAAVREQLLYAEDLDATPAPQALALAAARLAVEWEAGMTPAEKRAALWPFVKQTRVRPAAYKGEPVSDRVRVVPQKT